MKVKTGIEGFDALTKGGLPQEKLVLLSGTPGTGKTIFGLQYIYEGAKKFNERGIYISFEESPQSIKEQAKQFGWNFDAIEDKVKIIQYPLQALTHTSGEEIIQLIANSKSQRFVIDSLSALSFNVPSKNGNTIQTKNSIQKFIYEFIAALRKDNKATGLIISQTTKDDVFSGDGVSEFICDGIVHIYYESMGGAFSRSLQVRKLRQVHHEEGVYPMEIATEGIKIHYD
jgi:circadian clock protein KaiC